MRIKNKDLYGEYVRIFEVMHMDNEILYPSLTNLIPALDNLLNLAPSIIYIIDYRTMNYVYFNDSVAEILGYDSNRFKKEGTAFALTLFHPEDLDYLVKNVYPYIKKFLKTIPFEQHKEYKFSFNCRYKRSDGIYIQMLQHATYMESDQEGNPIINFGIVTDISQFKKDTAIQLSILKKKDAHFEYISVDYEKEHKDSIFTKRELEILNLVKQGFNSAAIAGKLFLSEHTINNHRKNMLKKTGTSNTTALIDYAVTYGYIQL